MSLQVTGKVIEIGNTQTVNERFKKREFVIEISEDINGNTYTNYAKFQAVQNKCEILDRFQIGQSITVDFNIKGNRWEKDGKVNYTTNLDAWRIVAAESAPSAPYHTTTVHSGVNAPGAGYYNPTSDNVDDQLPF